MSRTVSSAALATQGNEPATGCHTDTEMETDGKAVAIGFLNEVIEESGVQRKVLAAECKWSEGQFSKVASGQQGDLFELVYRLPAHRAAIRAAFFGRLIQSEQRDAISDATEQLAIAAIRWFRAARAVRAMPARSRMAKAEPGAPTRRAINE